MGASENNGEMGMKRKLLPVILEQFLNRTRSLLAIQFGDTFFSTNKTVNYEVINSSPHSLLDLLSLVTTFFYKMTGTESKQFKFKKLYVIYSLTMTTPRTYNVVMKHPFPLKGTRAP